MSVTRVRQAERNQPPAGEHGRADTGQPSCAAGEESAAPHHFHGNCASQVQAVRTTRPISARCRATPFIQTSLYSTRLPGRIGRSWGLGKYSRPAIRCNAGFWHPSARASLPAVYSHLHSPRTTPTPCRDLFPGYEEELGFLDISLRERDSLR